MFLAFYRELTHRHWHAVSRPSLRDRMEGWEVYRDLFDELLMDAEENNGRVSDGEQPKLFILPGWAFDILHEFVYQFQGFCQFRTTLYSSCVKHNLLPHSEGEPNPKAPHHVVEHLAIFQDDPDEAASVWNVETVLSYLHRLVALGTSPKCNVPAYQYFGIFASVALSRLECLLCDYSNCLNVMQPILLPSANLKIAPKADQETLTFVQVIYSVFPARLSMTYHAGISFLMLRRYKDAVKMVGDLCSYMQRGFKVCSLFFWEDFESIVIELTFCIFNVSCFLFNVQKTGQLRKLPNADQLSKNYDRMIALLAICTHLCFAAGTSGTSQDAVSSSLSGSSSTGGGIVEEPIARVIREKHGGQLSSKDSAYTDLFVFCAPKFVSPQVFDFFNTSGNPGPPSPPENAYKHQIHVLEQRILSYQPAFSKLRSYLKLYTSLDVDQKLVSSFGNDEVTLACLKLHAQQWESDYAAMVEAANDDGKAAGDDAAAGTAGVDKNTAAAITEGDCIPCLKPATLKSSLDFHYYITNTTTDNENSVVVHIDAADKQRRYENYFLTQIGQSCDIRKDVSRISTKV